MLRRSPAMLLLVALSVLMVLNVDTVECRRSHHVTGTSARATASLFRLLGSNAMIPHGHRFHQRRVGAGRHMRAGVILHQKERSFPVLLPSGGEAKVYEHELKSMNYPTKDDYNAEKWQGLSKWQGPHGRGDYPYKAENEGGVGAWAGAYMMGREKAEAITNVNPGELAQLWTDIDNEARLQNGVDRMATGGAFEADGYGGAYGEKYGDMIDKLKTGVAGGYGPMSLGGMPHVRNARHQNQYRGQREMLGALSGLTPNDLKSFMMDQAFNPNPAQLMETEAFSSSPSSSSRLLRGASRKSAHFEEDSE